MELISLTILIDADTQTVWHKMLDDKTYREWTTEFHAGSYYEGSWDQGSEIRFLGTNDKGEPEGMFSRIKENIPFQFLSIEHLGMVSNGIVDTTSEEVKKWAPSFENYSFIEKDGQTELKVDMQIDAAYKEMFEEMWPRALKVLKALCEK